MTGIDQDVGRRNRDRPGTNLPQPGGMFEIDETQIDRDEQGGLAAVSHRQFPASFERRRYPPAPRIVVAVESSRLSRNPLDPAPRSGRWKYRALDCCRARMTRESPAILESAAFPLS